ncbi:hypothetical protein [Aquincola tertiaricarbonis]|uniref:hypothetical protein n=1 Tax=Aquincola tertiaricarbonis TaxID=391953 RepID=UPI0006151298|nr:hypothetical protein [Aquincola tertiaricarbonis]
MADSTTQQIIAVALGTHVTHPKVPVLEVLDLAMKGHEGSDLSFEAGPGHAFDDWLDPPSPFADLLRQAFAPEIGQAQLALWHSDSDFLAEGFREMWDADVVKAFAVRYRLWE